MGFYLDDTKYNSTREMCLSVTSPSPIFPLGLGYHLHRAYIFGIMS